MNRTTKHTFVDFTDTLLVALLIRFGEPGDVERAAVCARSPAAKFVTLKENGILKKSISWLSA